MTLSKTMPRLLLELLRELESIGIDNEEIYDTVCREKMSDPIWKLFIRPVRRYKWPDDFGLSSDNANREVKQALQKYIQEASKTASLLSLRFYKRLLVFQDRNVSTYPRRSYFDDFFKWRDPHGFDASGKWFGVEKNTMIEQERLEEDLLALYSIPEGQLRLFDL